MMWDDYVPPEGYRLGAVVIDETVPCAPYTVRVTSTTTAEAFTEALHPPRAPRNRQERRVRAARERRR